MASPPCQAESLAWFLPRRAGEGDHAKHGGGGMTVPQEPWERSSARRPRARQTRPLRLASLATSPRGAGEEPDRGGVQNPRSVAKVAASARARRNGPAGNNDSASTAAAA